jgi:LPXTG-motif cell wall-anchored protein
MPAHLVTAALATLAAAAPAHSARAHVPVERHVAAGSSFGQPPRTGGPTARPAPAHAHARRIRQDLHVAPAPPRRRRVTVRPRTATRRHPLAHGAAGDPAVTISDFHFTAATTTVHVGDAITWTNDGPSAHTATANDGSFNTGTLNRGQSASHTFTQPGTYSYICTIHPFMHGTIVVLAAATSSTPQTTTAPSTTASTPTTLTPAPASPSGSAATTTTAASASAGRPSLPNTGIDVISAVAVGGILLTAGLALRRAVRP